MSREVYKPRDPGPSEKQRADILNMSEIQRGEEIALGDISSRLNIKASVASARTRELTEQGYLVKKTYTKDNNRFVHRWVKARTYSNQLKVSWRKHSNAELGVEHYER